MSEERVADTWETMGVSAIQGSIADNRADWSRKASVTLHAKWLPDS